MGSPRRDFSLVDDDTVWSVKGRKAHLGQRNDREEGDYSTALRVVYHLQ